MSISISKLAQLSGVSTRTLRYYDEIGLLTPERISRNGYRVYGQKEIDLLQQIMFYRELGVVLEEIKKIIYADDYEPLSALQKHLTDLQSKKDQIVCLIKTVEQTIAAAKGEIIMTNKEKFSGFKAKLVEDNEKKFGQEIREKYGDGQIDASNAKLMGLSAVQYDHVESLSREINGSLKRAFDQGDPSSELAQKTCALHKEWICYFWSEYSKEAHLGLVQTYVDDPRFRAYYDAVAKGSADFLYQAMKIYCQE